MKLLIFSAPTALILTVFNKDIFAFLMHYILPIFYTILFHKFFCLRFTFLTGRRGRPRVHGERLELSSIVLNKPEGASYHMGCRKVTTNLRKGRTVYACLTAADPEKPGSFHLFLCAQAPEGIAVQPQEHAGEKIRMNIIIHSLGQTIETIKKELPQKRLFRSLCANAVIYKTCKMLFIKHKYKFFIEL
ncbi:MAG: hypothetical protein K2O06_02960 [Acetatifactor sp.]|nr:hypothetical protein [Acetatifactor sp.]